MRPSLDAERVTGVAIHHGDFLPRSRPDSTLRTALLAAVKRTPTGGLRAEQELGGRSVLAWQVELVRALGCERIVCLCEAPGGQVLALQKRVEAEGGAFHAIRSNIQLASLVRADDELVMILDGLVADRATAMAASGFAPENGARLDQWIATISASHPLAEDHPEDFERIDRDRHWAGLAVMRASHVHTVADLPPDSELMSLLLRLALQARVKGKPVESDTLDSGRWMLATNNEALAKRESALVESSVTVPPWSGPSNALAAVIAQRIAPRWLGIGSEISAVAAVALCLGGVALVASGMVPLGLGAVGLGALVAMLSGAWGRLRAALWSEDRGAQMRKGLGLMTDLLAVAALLLAVGPGSPESAQIALPLIAVGLARHLGSVTDDALSAFWGDRASHLVFFAITAAWQVLNEALALFALGAVVQLLLRGRRN